ncbi:MAG: 23S rRNA (uracil(1939)-C(5))-methyltransferase RlmD [Sedimentibacter sp.]
MLEKGQIKEVEIIDLNYTGKGVAKIDNFVVFIENAIEGDLVEIEIIEKKKNFAIGKISKIIKASKNRIEPSCEYFYDCGGCQLMHMDYNAQLVYKKNRVISEFKRASVNMEKLSVNDTIGMENPFKYRNKTAFSVAKIKNQVAIGPYEDGTYSTVDIMGCMIQSEEANKAVRCFKKLMVKYNIESYNKKTGTGTVKHIVIRNNIQNELMFIIVTSKYDFPNKDSIVNDLKSQVKEIKTIVQNINSKNTNIVMGYRNITLFGDGTITDSIKDLTFSISPETFFQVNSQQTEKLFDTAIEYANLNKDDICFDIYCGIGTISLMAAKYVKKVYGVEIVEQSVVNAKENAKSNHISNVEFLYGSAEKILPELYNKSIIANVVIVDPPRKGCEKEVIDSIINMAPERIVYVSCNPSTLARDVKLLELGGYHLVKIQPVDMFPWTYHVETVLLMEKKEVEIQDSNDL